MRRKIQLLLLLICLPLFVWAKSQIIDSRIKQKENTLYVDVDSQIDLPVNIQQAIDNGLILFFEYLFEIKSEKWYDIGTIAKLQKRYILSYHRMTGEYQVEDPVTYRIISFPSLPAAVEYMQHLRQFPLIPAEQVNQANKEQLTLRVKFHLLTENLPIIVRLERLFNDRWKADSDWTVWRIH